MILTFRGFGFPIGIGSARPSSMKRSILVLLFLTISNRSQGRNSFPTLFLPELRSKKKPYSGVRLSKRELIFGFQSSKTLRALVTALLVTLNSSIPVSSKQRIFLWHILKAKHTLRQRLFMRLFAST